MWKRVLSWIPFVPLLVCNKKARPQVYYFRRRAKGPAFCARYVRAICRRKWQSTSYRRRRPNTNDGSRFCDPKLDDVANECKLFIGTQRARTHGWRLQRLNPPPPSSAVWRPDLSTPNQWRYRGRTQQLCVFIHHRRHRATATSSRREKPPKVSLRRCWCSCCCCCCNSIITPTVVIGRQTRRLLDVLHCSVLARRPLAIFRRLSNDFCAPQNTRRLCLATATQVRAVPRCRPRRRRRATKTKTGDEWKSSAKTDGQEFNRCEETAVSALRDERRQLDAGCVCGWGGGQGTRGEGDKNPNQRLVVDATWRDDWMIARTMNKSQLRTTSVQRDWEREKFATQGEV